MSRDKSLGRVAARQAGIFTRTQAGAAGFSEAEITHRLASGQWLRVHRGVFRAATTPTTRVALESAALLAAGRDSALSRTSAGAHLGFMNGESRIHVRIPYARSVPRLKGVDVHRCRSHPSGLEVVKGPVRVTSPADTLIDCAETVASHELRLALDAAVGSQRVTVLALLHRCEQLEGRHRLRRLLALVDELPAGCEEHDSPLETEFARLMERHGIRGWTHHARIETEAGVFEADFAWPHERVVVETDGKVHDYPDQRAYDIFRDTAMHAAGWTVVRLRWRDVFFTWRNTIALLRRALRIGGV